MEVREYTLKLSTEQAQGNVDLLNESLKLQEDLIEDIEKELAEYQKQLTKTSKKDLAARSAVNKKIQETKTRLIEEKSGLKSVTKERKRANETLKESTANAADYSGVLGMIDSKTGGLISGMKGMTKSVGGATKGFNLMKIAIIGTGIGALLIGILAVSKAFTSSEAGQNKFSKMMGVIGSVVGNLVDILANLGEGIISVFENPKQAIIDLKNLIVENITNRITSLIDTFGFLGSAIKKVFSGDFSGAMDDAKSAGSGFVDTMTGVKDTVNKVSDSVKNLANEIIKEGNIAAGIADQRAKADKLDRQLIVERAEANRKRAELLEKAVNKEKFNLKERVAFLQEAGQIEDDITKKEVLAAKLRYSAKIAENKLSKSTKEDLTDEANLKAKLIDLETAKLTKAKLVTTQISALNKEAAATDIANATEKDAAIESIRKSLIDTEVEERKEKLRLIEEDYNKQLELTALYYTNDTEKTKELEAAKKLALDEQQAEFDEKDKEKAALKREEDAALLLEIQEAEAITEEEKRALEIEKVTARYDKLIAIAEAANIDIAGLVTAREDKIDKINDKGSKNEIKWAELTEKEKAKLISDGFNNLATILGKESAAGKAAAIAGATIATYQSAVNSYNALSPITIVGPALGALAAGAAVVSGFSNIKKIASTKTPGPSVSAPSLSAPTMPTLPTIPSAPPAFNVVGASDTNQLADAIGGQSQQPVQAFVVSSDVTTSQELDRNIVQGASIG